MKKLVAGCLIVLLVAAAGLGAAVFYAYRWAQPVIQSTGDYLDRARAMTQLADRIANKAPYLPPESGELTQSQIERFIAVQTRVRDELGTRWTEIENKSAQIREKTQQNHRELSFAEVASVFSDLTGIYLEARRAQVNALNVQRFSEDEYAWVRRRVYEAAGVELAGAIDLSKLESAMREGAERSNMTLPDMPKPQVPAANVALVKPHLAKVKEWVPMAVLGL
jgi:hypothetical protein